MYVNDRTNVSLLPELYVVAECWVVVDRFYRQTDGAGAGQGAGARQGVGVFEGPSPRP